MKQLLAILLAVIITGSVAVAYANDTLHKLGPIQITGIHTTETKGRTGFIAQPAARVNLQYQTNAVTLQSSDTDGILQPARD